MFSSLCTSVSMPNGEILITKYKQKSDHFRWVDNGGAGTTPLEFRNWSGSVGHWYKLWYEHGHGYGLIFILSRPKKKNVKISIKSLAFYECKLCKSI